ncbi:MAG: HRDC domain-containing protein [Bacteroidales bacterium]
MQYYIGTIPVVGGEEELELFNRFLRSNKVLKVDKELITQGDSSYWTFCVTYIFNSSTTGSALPNDRKERKDYRLLLSEEHFSIFSKLRVYRKQLAETNAIPAYSVFTDAELSEIAKLTPIDEKEMLGIDRIGLKRVDKFGSHLAKLYNDSL